MKTNNDILDLMTASAVSDEQIGEMELDDRFEEEVGRIDGVARIRIADHIRECSMRYGETKESLRRVHERMDDADKARSNLFLAVIIAIVGVMGNIVLHFLPNGHP